MKINYKALMPHAVAIVVFIIVSFAYFAPAASGYKLKQHDTKTFNGMSAEIQDYREKFNSEPFWTSHPFGGMPAGLISQRFPNNWMVPLDRAFQLWLPHPINLLFVAMICFYILMLCLRVNPWVGIAGAVAFGFSTYTILIIGAGHNTKALAIAYMPAVLGTLILAYRSRPILGSVLFMFFMALELRASHLQVTYYLAMILIFYAIAEFIRFIKNGEVVSFLSRSFLVVFAAGLSILPNYSMIRSTLEVGKETTRSESKLTINPDGTPNKSDKTSGLDRSYITGWSYGIKESWNLLIPNAAGGNSRAFGEEAEANLSEDTNPQIVQQIQQTNAYWGPQDQGTGGPTYLGAVVILLFIMALVFLPDIAKWGILAATVLGLMLSWGKNYMGLTDFFIDNVPGYDKFRAVTILLCILQLTVPFLAFWFVDHLSKNREKYLAKIKWVYGVGGAVGFVLLLFYVMPGSFFDFLNTEEKTMFSKNMSGADQQMNVLYADYKKGLIEARTSLFKADTMRSFAFILFAFGVIFTFLRYLPSKPFLYVGIGLLAFIDLWGINTRYLNNNEDPSGQYEYASWIPPEEEKDKPYFASEADKSILQTELATRPELQKIINDRITVAQQKTDDEPLSIQAAERIMFCELGFATNYRVLNARDPFNDGTTPYFHKSIGGYHGAKQKRIAEIIAFHYQPELQSLLSTLGKATTILSVDSALANMQVINMMNAKYIIGDPSRPAIPNRFAFGNGWFVGNIYAATSADDEILSLRKHNLRTTAVVDKQSMNSLAKIDKTDSTGGTITMTSFKPNYITYETNSNGTYLAVFSEIYASGWKAYVDGAEAPVIRANYMLRSIVLPKGKHKVEWKYTLAYYAKSETISIIGSLLVVLIMLVLAFLEFTGRLQRDKIPAAEVK
ncbi:MAG: YfhO family protein [Flavobacteriales bacterium]